MAPEPGLVKGLLWPKLRTGSHRRTPENLSARYSGPPEGRRAFLCCGGASCASIGALLGGRLEGLPLVPGLLELVGVIWLDAVFLEQSLCAGVSPAMARFRLQQRAELFSAARAELSPGAGRPHPSPAVPVDQLVPDCDDDSGDHLLGRNRTFAVPTHRRILPWLPVRAPVDSSCHRTAVESLAEFEREIPIIAAPWDGWWSVARQSKLSRLGALRVLNPRGCNRYGRSQSCCSTQIASVGQGGVCAADAGDHTASGLP